MSISSMTGYARAQGGDAAWRWVWEARSVNGRGLELRIRLPAGLEHLDPIARAEIAKRFTRGSLTINLSVTADVAASAWRINHTVLDQVIGAAQALAKRLETEPPRVDGLLALRGVIETGETSFDAPANEPREKAMIATLGEALDGLRAARLREGAALKIVLGTHLDDIAALTRAAAALAEAQPEAIRHRLSTRLAELVGASPPMAPDRLAQEIALLATRGDAREELDRLAAHVEQARGLLGEAAAIGRKLDFLTQEFNREANTLCSKSDDLALTRIGLSLKATIDRLREQAANIE